jgi:pimeloyl-ACP methyl ester carboxylesterase
MRIKAALSGLLTLSLALLLTASGQEEKPPAIIETEQAFIKTILEEGVEKARQVYENAKKRNPQVALFRESALNSLGYDLLYKQKRVKEALDVFLLNLEAYPTSFNVYDSLGEAYLVNAETELAVKNYKKSLELNPQNRNAVDMLARLWIGLPQDRWIDRSPHKPGFVTVNGVRLHYLDWGGQGEALLFLTGMGNSAHIFDTMAPLFIDRFRVLSLTRRGHGRSDKPESGYDNDTLVEDIRQFLDALNITRVNLAGHSLAGNEMTRFAELYPARLGKIVYLDAANDYSELTDNDIVRAIPEVFSKLQPAINDVRSYAAYRGWLKKARYGFWSEEQEADTRETLFGPDGKLKPTLSGNVAGALSRGARAFRPDFAKVKAPALSFYMIPSLATYFPWLLPGDEPARGKARAFLNETLIPIQHKRIERFRKEAAGGQVVVMPDTHHYLFITRRREVVTRMRVFLRPEEKR